jgi:hypothetical protein
LPYDELKLVLLAHYKPKPLVILGKAKVAQSVNAVNKNAKRFPRSVKRTIQQQQ